MSTRAKQPSPYPPADRSGPPFADRRALPLRRIFGEGEDPLTWSFPIGRFFGIHIRLHAIVPLWAGAEVIACYGLGDFYFMHGVCAAFAFIALAVVRELAKLLLARALGSDADQAIVWPLGGVTPAASPLPPVPSSHAGEASPVLAESGGLLAGMLLWPVLALASFLVGIPWSYLSISPFSPLLNPPADIRHSLLPAAVWWLYYANMLQVLFNLLVPMLPLDAGRMLFALSASRRGRIAAAEFVGRVGAFGAIALLIVGSTADQSRLIAIGVIGFLATVSEVRRAQFEMETIQPPPPRDSPPDAEPRRGPPAPGTLDEILAKIARRGIDSLEEEERETLRRETARRRRG